MAASCGAKYTPVDLSTSSAKRALAGCEMRNKKRHGTLQRCRNFSHVVSKAQFETDDEDDNNLTPDRMVSLIGKASDETLREYAIESFSQKIDSPWVSFINTIRESQRGGNDEVCHLFFELEHILRLQSFERQLPVAHSNKQTLEHVYILANIASVSDEIASQVYELLPDEVWGKLMMQYFAMNKTFDWPNGSFWCLVGNIADSFQDGAWGVLCDGVLSSRIHNEVMSLSNRGFDGFRLDQWVHVWKRLLKVCMQTSTLLRPDNARKTKLMSNLIMCLENSAIWKKSEVQTELHRVLILCASASSTDSSDRNIAIIMVRMLQWIDYENRLMVLEWAANWARNCKTNASHLIDVHITMSIDTLFVSLTMSHLGIQQVTVSKSKKEADVTCEKIKLVSLLNALVCHEDLVDPILLNSSPQLTYLLSTQIIKDWDKSSLKLVKQVFIFLGFIASYAHHFDAVTILMREFNRNASVFFASHWCSIESYNTQEDIPVRGFLYLFLIAMLHQLSKLATQGRNDDEWPLKSLINKTFAPQIESHSLVMPLLLDLKRESLSS